MFPVPISLSFVLSRSSFTMATIALSGLPDNCKLPKMVIVFRSLLRKEGISKFWIKEMSDIRDTDLKLAKIEFDSIDNAYRALNVLDGFAFNDGQYVYPLSACIDNEYRERKRRRSPSPYRHRSREFEYEDQYSGPSHSRYNNYLRERSRSPLMRHEASKLDLEIELLRKQRMIIEEERKILLERKKLELVKEYGPSALKEFAYIEDDRDRERDRDRRYRAERAPERRPPPRGGRGRLPPRPIPAQRPRDRQPIPQFVLPCKLLLAELKETMEKLSTRKESFLLTKLIRGTIRKRLAVALEGKPIMSGAKIAALYREKYPKHQDEDFVVRHLNDVRACQLGSGDEAEDTEIKINEGKIEHESKEIGEKVDAGTTHAHGVKTEPVDRTGDSPGLAKEEPNSSVDTVVNESVEQTGIVEQTDRPERSRSVGSSEALTLHDNNDEDWVKGETNWDDNNAAVP